MDLLFNVQYTHARCFHLLSPCPLYCTTRYSYVGAGTGTGVGTGAVPYLDTILKIEYLHGFSFVPQKLSQECQSRSHLLECVRVTFGANKMKQLFHIDGKLVDKGARLGTHMIS
jgi:hypothetical protein